MSTVVTITGPGRVVVEREEPPELRSGQVRVRTIYSGISAGTELTSYRGSNPYLHKEWDPELRLFREGRSSTTYPQRAPGYEDVGEVVEVGSGVEAPTTGTVVYGAWGHRSEAVLEAAYLSWRSMPEGLDPLPGIFGHIGSVALNGMHDAGLRVGETVAVFGLGVLGQIVCQLARCAGAEVLAVDPLPSRRELAMQTSSADRVYDPSAGSLAEQIKEHTGGRGADIAIEASGAVPALHEAVRTVAYSSKVIALGFYQGGAPALRLGEEFHHNRIAIVSSQISGVSPELSSRWDRRRLAGTIMRLQAAGKLRLEALVSHMFDAGSAAEAYRLLDEEPDKALQVVLDFRKGPGRKRQGDLP